MRMVNKRFFKPLLPGFHSHLTIPVAFFLKHVEGTNEHHHTAKLRSDASMITWEVKIEDGQKLTKGWKEFALAHNLRIGDILIFRQEKDMAFHVTLLGPSGCEIQYESCSEEGNNFGKIPKKKNSDREAEVSSLDPSCFVANIWPSSLRYDSLNLPKSFVRENGLETRCGGEIVLMNEKGGSWTLALKQKISGPTYIRRGWRNFCNANGLKSGGLYTFKLIQRGRTPVLRLSSTESESEERNLEKKNSKREAESSSLDHSCFVANISRATLCYDTLHLPKKFSRENGLETRCGEIVVMNEKGRSWKLNLKRKSSCGTMYITRGWRSFCSANGLRAGSSITFKLIKRGGTLVLRLSPKETEEQDCSANDNEMESLSTEPESDEENIQYEKKIKKHRSTWKASSSQSQNRFVTLTLRPSNLKKYILFLPTPFSRSHGINEETTMTLLDKNGVKWSTDLRSEENSDRIRLVGGWQEFFKANCVKTGESIIVKLIWEGDKSCVLKFCSKVKHETK